MAGQHNDTTVEESILERPVAPIVVRAFDENDLEIAASTHVGKKRSTNEDQYCVVRRTRSSDVLASSLPPDDLTTKADHCWLLAVADGLGGHASGEVASAIAIRTILDFANRLSSWIMRPVEGLREDVQERVDLYIGAIQDELHRQAQSNPSLESMATTITSAYVYGDQAAIVNVGDSRSYLVRPGSIHQITVDHTLERELIEQGLSEQFTRPYRNMVTRCLNTRNERVPVDLFHVELQPGDRILLCSDGLSDMVDDDSIHDIVMTASSNEAACEQLVQAALGAGGRDNITVTLACVTRDMA